MAMKRICDICGKATGTLAYQFSVPAQLIDNNGKDQNPGDSSATDVCSTCAKGKQAEIVALLVKKATPASEPVVAM